MTDETKYEVVLETSGHNTEHVRSRRIFLKWGIIGVLVACPVGIAVRRKLKGNKYQYVLKGPFQLLEGKDYAYFNDANLWIGSRRNKMYTPNRISLQLSGEPDDDNSEVTFMIFFDVAKDASKNLLAEAKVSFYSNEKVFAFQETQWISPHKQPPRVESLYSGAAPTVSARPPEEYLLVTIPFADLGKIDKIVLVIDEIVRV